MDLTNLVGSGCWRFLRLGVLFGDGVAQKVAFLGMSMFWVLSFWWVLDFKVHISSFRVCNFWVLGLWLIVFGFGDL